MRERPECPSECQIGGRPRTDLGVADICLVGPILLAVNLKKPHLKKQGARRHWKTGTRENRHAGKQSRWKAIMLESSGAGRQFSRIVPQRACFVCLGSNAE